MTRAILPCAGFGTRLNMPKDKSKELLRHYGTPLIEHQLEICSIHKLTPLVVTRKEKVDLISYCETHNVEVQIIEPEGEWPGTVLKSCTYWTEDNVLLLPDTVFNPISAIENIKFGLEMGNDAVFAMHEVSDISKWGSITNCFLTEKSSKTRKGNAWGIIGFKNNYGIDLFQAMREKNKPFKLTNCGFVKLSKFDDVTRGEAYGETNTFVTRGESK